VYNKSKNRFKEFMLKKFTCRQKEIRRRIIELSYQYRFSHVGSCLIAVDIIDAIYRAKRKDEHFVLSSGHAAIALYVILEKNNIIDSSVIEKLHIHPDRNINFGIEVSTGSLGQGLPIALGMALADRKKRVFCVVSDGECAEGSIWESFRVICENNVSNLITIVNANGWGAYAPISQLMLLSRIKGFGFNVMKIDGLNPDKILAVIEKASAQKGPSVIFAKTFVEQLPFLKGQDAHYYVMNENDYKTAMRILK
jgi:transketolase